MEPLHADIEMANSIWTTEVFACPGCGVDYTATREEHQHKRSGSFKCRVCDTEVHAWSGAYDFFGPLGDLIMWGPTGTNVSDLHVALVER